MSRRLAALCLSLGCLPFAARAAGSFDLATHACSGALTQQAPGSFSCHGDYRLDSGRITSDIDLVLAATGTLWLGEVVVTAPSLSLLAGGDVTLSAAAQLQVNGASSSGPATVLWRPALEVRGGAVLGTGGEQGHVEIQPGAPIALQGAGVVLQPGRISVLRPVPEPSAVASALAGVLLLGVAARRGRRQP